ncbi:MAG TPA: M20/M25/M40 family metallo-hydrolase [Bdellovibrionales bacterium]|nr:M20/M25/M40 family metallo-hydrolase [Bdellovibrionales bacterium]
MSVDKALKQFESDKSDHIEALKKLVRIPSVSFPDFDPKEVENSARFVAGLFREMGLDNVELLYAKGNPRPYVYGEWLKAPGAPTLLLYAHHDVQPPGREERWQTPPFEPTLKGDRLFGRGAADDKAGVIIHTATIQSWLRATGRLPVNVKLLIEGEEEIGSPGLEGFLAEHKQKLQADILLLTDTENYSVDRPGLTVALRGIVAMNVEVKALKQSVHSGMWGGPLPDPAMALSKMLATLVDENGQIAVHGLLGQVAPLSESQRKNLEKLGEDETEFRKQSGVLDGVPLLKGPGGIKEKIWFRPSITVNALEASSRKQAANIIVDGAWAKVSVRLVPDMNPQKVFDLVKAHLEKNCPFGLKVSVEADGLGGWWKTETSHPAFDAILKAMKEAWNAEPVLMGCGGSIPFVQPFATALGGAPALLIGVEDPYTAAHSENESLHMGVFEKSIQSCIRFFEHASKLKR